MRLLDLFCGAGGAAMGYHLAGYDEIVGVDVAPQPRYPFTFIQADALDFPLEGFDLIHASPPCQAYVRGWKPERGYWDSIPPVRARLEVCDTPWVIENVPGAPLRDAVMLCGSMFGLGVRRHRLFESPILASRVTLTAASCRHDYIPLSVTGNGTPLWTWKQLGRGFTVVEAREAMGIPWMTRKELSQAIPPAYTEWVGRQMIGV